MNSNARCGHKRIETRVVKQVPTWLSIIPTLAVGIKGLKQLGILNISIKLGNSNARCGHKRIETIEFITDEGEHREFQRSLWA